MRLIDADALRRDVLELPDCPNGYSDTFDKSMILALVDEAPTVDAVPVKHGKWLWFDGVRCSQCNYKLATTGLPSYCPNCGARMLDEWEKENK